MPKADGPQEIEKLRRSILFPLNSQIYVSRGALLLVKIARMYLNISVHILPPRQ